MLRALPFGPNEAKLLIEASLFERIATFRQLALSAPEAGGILMGYRRGPHIHVTEATAPSRRDVQRRFAFFRNAAYHQRVALRRWNETDQTLDYVGEWHSHPEDNPVPSGIDLREWREITAANIRPMVFLIVGRHTNWIGVGLRDRIIEIQPSSVDE